jgi:hypothetical protein
MFRPFHWAIIRSRRELEDNFLSWCLACIVVSSAKPHNSWHIQHGSTSIIILELGIITLESSTELEILCKWSTWCTILSMYLFLFLTLYVSSTSCSSSGETNCVNTTSGNCHSVLVAVSYAGRKWTFDLHTTRPPTQSDSYQRLYWHNLSLLMMRTMCSKHAES